MLLLVDVLDQPADERQLVGRDSPKRCACSHNVQRRSPKLTSRMHAGGLGNGGVPKAAVGVEPVMAVKDQRADGAERHLCGA